MRQLIVIVLLASVNLGSISAAPTASIGIYRDAFAQTSCGSSPSQIFNIYVYLLLPNNPNGVSRVPFRVERQLSASTFIIGWFPVQGSVDLGDAEYLNHEIVFSEPRFGTTIRLMAINLLTQDDDVDQFWIGPYPGEYTLAYVDGQNELGAILPANGNFTSPSLILDGECQPVDARKPSWARLKALYR